MPPAIRGSDVFLQADLLRILKGLAVAHKTTSNSGLQQNAYTSGYSDGFLAALHAFSESVGVRLDVGGWDA